MTREKYESLPLSMLKALAKSRNMKGISTLRKEALIERMLEEDQKENQKNMEEPAVLKEEKKTETVQDQNQEPQEKREDGMERQNRETSENGTARPYQRPRYVRREERSENGERQEYRPRAPRFNERRFQEPRNYNQNREKEQRQEPRQEAGQEMRQEPLRQEARPETRQEPRQETSTLDSGQEACGILEVMPDGFGFIRSDNYMPGDSDVYVSPSQIRRFGLKTGDIIRGNTRVKSATEKFSALLYLKSVNNLPLDQIMRRGNFEDMTPVFPDERLRLERPGGSMAMRIVDLVSPIGKGQRGMIVSPPKAGKTTLLNILAGLDKPTSGSVLLDGKDLASIKESDRAAFRRDHLGFVFQEFNLLDTFSVEDNIYLPLVLAGVPQKELSVRLEPIAARLGITELLKKYPYEISGGQKQRAAVARAIITNPRLLLADEPTGALDSKATDELLRVFSDISRSGQTILMVTHSVRAASRAGRVLFIKDGEVYHQLYRGNLTDDQLYQKITDALTVLQAGGEQA